MENLISLTQQYLPDLEKILGNAGAQAQSSSSSYTSSTSGDRHKRKKHRRGIKKRKKIKKSTLESMQSHVNRLNRPTINLVIPSSAYRISSTGLITPPRKTIMPKYSPAIKRKMINDGTAGDQEKLSAINDVPTQTAKFVNSVQASHKQSIFKETKLGRGIKKRSADLEATKDAALTLKKKRDQFLSYLKNLQDELMALKIPEVSLSTNNANPETKASEKKILIKKTKKPKKNGKKTDQSTTKGTDVDTKRDALQGPSKTTRQLKSSSHLKTNSINEWKRRVQKAMEQKTRRVPDIANPAEDVTGILNYAVGPPSISQID